MDIKKLATSLLATLVIVSNASAKDGFYVGVDALQANADHKYKVISGRFTQTGATTKATSTGFALDVGYKFEFDKVFVAPEVFYDHLGNSANDFTYADAPANYKDRIDLKSRYGAKINLGYKILPKLSVFVNAGFANVSHGVKWLSSNEQRYAHKLAMLYGIGASYNFNNNWAVRTSYDNQQFAIQEVYEGLRSKVNLTVIKAGVVYSF